MRRAVLKGGETAEDVLQRDFALYMDSLCVTLARTFPMRWCHIPNEGNRGKWGHLAAMKKGLKPGASDNLIFPSHRPTLQIELKSLHRRVEPEQKTWIADMNDLGHPAAIIRAADCLEMRQQVSRFLSHNEIPLPAPFIYF